MSERTSARRGPARRATRTSSAVAAVALLLIGLTATLIAPAGAAPTAPAQPAPVDDGPGVPDDLAAEAADGGQVAVIVQLDTAFVPEGRLGTAARLGQRAVTRGVAEDVVADLPADSVEAVKPFRTVPYVAMTVDAEGLAQLADDPSVASISPDVVDDAALATSTTRIGAQALWATGVDGDGQAVAVIDTGVDSAHSFLSGKVVAEACFSRTLTSGGASSTAVCPDGTNPPGTASEIGPGAAAPCPVVGTACDHGTNVAGIVAGGTGASGSGVAPGADIIAIQVFSQFSTASCGAGATQPCARTWSSDQILALEHVYSLAGTYDIAAVNMSLGGGQNTTECTGDPRRSIIQNLASIGIPTVVSSGNDGYTNAIGAPACIPEAVSVGATSKTTDAVGSYSNSAAFLDLLAPGTSILGPIPDEGWAFYTGTSMAAPHVAGAFALLADAAPGATPAEALQALKDTGVDVLDTKSGVTTPRIQVDAAAEELTASPPAVTTVSPKVGATTGGRTVTITGTGFTGTTAVRFGPSNATSFTVVDDTTITAVTPARTAGLVNVWVETPSGTNTNAQPSWFTYQLPPTTAPTVTAITPNVGSIDGGTTVTISGTGFLTASSVVFGQTPAASFVVVSDTTITAVTAPRAAALVNVWITNPIGSNPNQASSWYSYRVVTGPPPTVATIAPKNGPAAGGTAVTITGTGFADATQVRFGPTNAASFTVVNDTTITAVAPSRPAGLVNVYVTSQNGTSTGGIQAWYRFT